MEIVVPKANVPAHINKSKPLPQHPDIVVYIHLNNISVASVNVTYAERPCPLYLVFQHILITLLVTHLFFLCETFFADWLVTAPVLGSCVL